MSVKKVIFSLVVLGVLAAFMAVPVSTIEAGKRPLRPPECVPINFLQEGYWGMYCYDLDHDIVSATLKTNSSNYSLNWNNSYAQMIVQLEHNTTINWSVCDSTSSCVGNSFN